MTTLLGANQDQNTNQGEQRPEEVARRIKDITFMYPIHDRDSDEQGTKPTQLYGQVFHSKESPTNVVVQGLLHFTPTTIGFAEPLVVGVKGEYKRAIYAYNHIIHKSQLHVMYHDLRNTHRVILRIYVIHNKPSHIQG